MAAQTGSSTSIVHLTANVVVVDMASGVLREVPIATIDYIDMVLSQAFLDVLNQFFTLAEVFVVVDRVRLQAGKNFSETALMQEARQVSVGAQFADSVVVAEVFAKQSSFVRGFAEALALADAFAKATAFSRSFADAVVFTETFGVRDGGGTGGLAKGIVDATAFSEARVRDMTKLRTDAAVLADAGTAFRQNYADPTYFAEQYVGTLTTF